MIQHEQRPVRAVVIAVLLTVVVGCAGPPASTSAGTWSQMDGAPCAWEIQGTELVVSPGAGSIRTRESFTDFSLHIEFMVPESLPGASGQNRGNSGVYIQNRYEVQILDSWGLEPSKRDCGALYGRVAPRVNASRPPGEWQEYDIDFTAARFDASGEKKTNARITVRHNGVLIHDDVELEGKTGAGAPEGPEPGPIVLQDHGSRLRFRNIRIRRR